MTHYYPYGGILSRSTKQGVQKFKYNGKEFDTMHGLNMYDYGARQQDPTTGLFTSMDPLCEKYYNISPYSYCTRNPIRYVDPDGRKLIIWYVDKYGKDKTYTFRDNNKNRIITVPKSQNNFVRKVLQAYLYNKRNWVKQQYKDKSGLMKLAESTTKDVMVKEISDDDCSYKPKVRLILWNPTKALSTTNGTKLSPATILVHEGDHAEDDISNPSEHEKRVNIANIQYKNEEEKRVILGDEQKQAIANGECSAAQPTREDHYGTVYDVNDPTKVK